MTISGVRLSSGFENQFSSAISDKKLEGQEYQRLKQEFARLNPNADFDAFLSERLQSQVDPQTLRNFGSRHNSAPVMLQFPIMQETARLNIDGQVGLNLTDRNGLANDAQNDLSGTINGQINISGVFDSPLGKFDFQDINNILNSAGFSLDAQGHLSADTSGLLGLADWALGDATNWRGHLLEGLRSAGIEARLREENGRITLEPQSLRLTGEQLRSMGVETPIPPEAQVQIDLSKAGLTFSDGQLRIGFNQSSFSGSSNASSSVDATTADPAQSESLSVDLSGRVTMAERKDEQGQVQTSVQIENAELRTSVDLRTLQSIQQRLNAEDPQSGSLHAQLRAAGLNDNLLSQIKSGSQEVLERLMRDPNSRLDLVLKAAGVELQTQQVSKEIAPPLFEHLKGLLAAENPETGALHRSLREAGLSDDFLRQIRESTPESLQNLLHPDRNDLNKVSQLNHNLDRLREALEADLIPLDPRTGVRAEGLSAEGTVTNSQGQLTGGFQLGVAELTARLSGQRQDLDAQGVEGSLQGSVNLTQHDVEQVQQKLTEYKTWIQDQLKTLGLSGDAFNQLIQMGSKENLQQLLSSATSAKIDDLSQRLGLSTEQTRKLVDFMNTDTFKQTVSDVFRLTELLGPGTQVEGKASFSLESLGWSADDQKSLAVLNGVSASFVGSASNQSGDQSSFGITVGTDKVTQEGPPGNETLTTGPVGVSSQISGNSYVNAGSPLSEPELLKALKDEMYTAKFYPGVLATARTLEQRTGVPAAVIMASVVKEYQDTPRAQRASFNVAASLERQADQLAQRYPQAAEAYRRNPRVRSFMDNAPGLRIPTLKPKLIEYAQARNSTAASAQLNSSGLTQNPDGTVTVGPGSYNLEQSTTNENFQQVSAAQVSGSFGELNLAERPEMLEAIQKRLQEQFNKSPNAVAGRPMQLHLESLGLDRDTIKRLRLASPEQLRAMLQEPALRPKLEPLIQSLRAASFSVNASAQANGQSTSAQLSAEDLRLEQGGTFSLKNLEAEIVNGQLSFKGQLGRFSSNSQETTLGDLEVHTAGPSGTVNVSSPDLSITNGGQVTGAVSGDLDLSFQGSDSSVSVDAAFDLRLQNGTIRATKISNGQLEAEVDVSTLMEMVRQDPGARELLNSLQQQGIVPLPGQKLKIRLNEAEVNSRGPNGTYSGTIELPNLRTNMGPMSIRLNVDGKTTASSNTQDIFGNLSFKPDPASFARLLNQQLQQAMGLDDNTRVSAGQNSISLNISGLITEADISISADGQNLIFNVDKARLLSIIDVSGSAANSIREAFAKKGVQVNERNGQLVIPVRSLNIMLQEQLKGVQLESLMYRNGELSGAFRFERSSS